MSDKVVAIMFSGGTDSTYAAWSQIPLYDRIHLVTFVRRGFRKCENVEEGVQRLRRAFPDKEILHSLENFEEIYQMVAPHEEKIEVQEAVLRQEIGPLWEDPHGARSGRARYEENLLKLFMANECLQCKIAMELAAIKFCYKSGIRTICDGSNTEQLDDGSQLEDVKTMARDIFGECGIRYLSPAFNISATERSRALFDAGITDHPDHKRLEKTHQIPSRQIQCTVPSAVLWTSCIFPWLVYDGRSCEDYVVMCCNYFHVEMRKGLESIFRNPESKFSH